MTKELGYGVNIFTKMFTSSNDPTVAKLEIYVYPMPAEEVPELSKDAMDFIEKWFADKGLTSGERIDFPPSGTPLN